ncbi:MAG: DsbE family thiol:disulfide interchange protein [Gammaproteobacteria bacterium]|nr:DsbE family thiol:disulfide interchange protein [Gammaproteobacteria bacterium]MYG13077.1 DsbE family thiol:disulfide interchange protein [Gammaproteobacteria bacterium]
MNRVGLFAPLAVFALILAIGYFGFQLEDPHRLPSALIGKPFPDFAAERLDGEGGDLVRRADLLGSPVLVNVWATWCPTCKAEHDELLRIRAETAAAGAPVRIIGVNYKDDPAKARRWLAEYGDPYDFNLIDADGALGVELGVYGAPETFLLNAKGDVVFKQVGAIDGQLWQQEIAPRLSTMGVPVAYGEARSDAG